jgi:hypothetical protein
MIKDIELHHTCLFSSLTKSQGRCKALELFNPEKETLDELHLLCPNSAAGKKKLDILEWKCNHKYVGCKKYLFGSQKVAKVLLKTFAIFFKDQRLLQLTEV